MINNVRLTSIVPKVTVANPGLCASEILDVLDTGSHENTDIYLLPRLSLCSPSSGSLLGNRQLWDASQKALEELREYSHDSGAYFFIGRCRSDVAGPVSSMAVLHRGSIIAELPMTDWPHSLVSSGLSETFDHPDSVFLAGDLRLQVFSQSLDQLSAGAANAAANGCDLLLVPLYEPMVAGAIQEIASLCRSLSGALGLAIAVTNGGIGDTSSPYFFHGFHAVYENGQELASQMDTDGTSLALTVDIDPDILRGGRHRTATRQPDSAFYQIPLSAKKNVCRQFSRNPFLPDTPAKKADYLDQLFAYQVRSLAARMEHTGLENLLVGLSGGLDSTAALLVAVAACDLLELPRENVYGVTLPGMGTSDQTYYNALDMLKRLEVTQRDIDISPAVQQHFKDIGHDGQPDTAYENAQARERTQILLDMANMVGGLVVGTGDLSEEALGFSTFGGDHLSNYNVNVCMTKTMLREQLQRHIDTDFFPGLGDLLKAVLDTPISPELLPPSPEGAITQKTEDILGPFVLHEFFLYYFVGYGMAPSKIYRYALTVFRDDMGDDFIKEKLELFLRRFAAGQFKRACAPDAAAITPINLLNVGYTLPSDLNVSALLEDLHSNS